MKIILRNWQRVFLYIFKWLPSKEEREVWLRVAVKITLRTIKIRNGSFESKLVIGERILRNEEGENRQIKEWKEGFKFWYHS